MLGDFNLDNYVFECVYVMIWDGVDVFVSFVYCKDKFKKDGFNLFM